MRYQSEIDSRVWWKGLSEVTKEKQLGKLSELHRHSLLEPPCPSPLYPWFLATSRTQPVLPTAGGVYPRMHTDTDMWKWWRQQHQVWFQSITCLYQLNRKQTSSVQVQLPPHLFPLPGLRRVAGPKLRFKLHPHILQLNYKARSSDSV